MNIKHPLTDEHKEHLASIGLPMVHEVDVDEAEYKKAKQAWKRTLPHADEHTLHMKALACCVHQQHHARKQMKVRWQSWLHAPELRWLIIGIGLILLIAFLSGRAHAQFSHISTIATCNGADCVGAHQVGFHASPFSIRCSTNMTCSDDGSTFLITSSATAGTAWDSLTNPTAGGLALTQFANGNDFWTVKRKTDTSPTGTFFRFQNALGTDLCALDITGALTSCKFPYGNLTGVPATFAPTAHNLLSASHGDTTAGSVSRGAGVFGIGVSPAWTLVAAPTPTNGYFKKNSSGDIVGSTGAAAGTGSCAASNWVNAENADAAPGCSRPTCADLSDSGSGCSGSGSSDVVLAQTSIQAGDTCTAACSFATTYTILANTMAVSDVYAVQVFGTNGNSGTGSNWSYGLKFGSTTLLSGGNVFENASLNGGWEEISQVTVISTGASGSVEAQGHFCSTTSGATNCRPLINTAVITVDTTVNQALTITEVATPGGTSPTTTMRDLVVRKN